MPLSSCTALARAGELRDGEPIDTPVIEEQGVFAALVNEVRSLAGTGAK